MCKGGRSRSVQLRGVGVSSGGQFRGSARWVVAVLDGLFAGASRAEGRGISDGEFETGRFLLEEVGGEGDG